LEFGSNVGASVIVYESLGARVVAVDIYDDYINLARLNAAQYGLNNISFIHEPDMRKLLFADKYFDLTNCNSVLEYVEFNKINIIQSEINRVLKSGGKIVITGSRSRLWPREVPSKKRLVNYRPRCFDRFTGLPNGLQRGISPWLVRYGFGRNYNNIDILDKFESYLRSTLTIFPSKATSFRALVSLARIVWISPGFFTPNISCMLQKE